MPSCGVALWWSNPDTERRTLKLETCMKLWTQFCSRHLVFKECTQCVGFNATINPLKMGLWEVQISEATRICFSKWESYHLIDGGTNGIHSLHSQCCWNWILTLACLLLKQLSSVFESWCEEAPIPRDTQWQEQQDDQSLIECLAYNFNIHFFQLKARVHHH